MITNDLSSSVKFLNYAKVKRNITCCWTLRFYVTQCLCQPAGFNWVAVQYKIQSTQHRGTFFKQSNRRSTIPWYFPFKCSLLGPLHSPCYLKFNVIKGS